MTVEPQKAILVVDDSPLMQTMLKDILTPSGYQVTSAGNGLDGCQLIETNRFDLIITDLKMPGMDGVTFIRRARQLPNAQHVPFVVMTGDNDQQRIDEAKQVGISTFLEKPFKGSKLKAILQMVLGT